MVDSDQTFEDHDPVGVLHPLEEQVRQVRDRHIRLLGAAEQIWKMHISNSRSNVALKKPLHSQSRCFLLGAMSSSVVALHTALARPWPAMECLAARMRSLIVWPLAISETDSVGREGGAEAELADSSLLLPVWWEDQRLGPS